LPEKAMDLPSGLNFGWLWKPSLLVSRVALPPVLLTVHRLPA